MLRILVELRRVGTRQIAHIAGKFDHSALHSEAQVEEGDAFSTCVADGRDFALNTSFAEPARHEDSVVSGQEPLGTVRFDILAADLADTDLRAVGDAGMIERFVN